jgi:hypothetical protein
MRRTIVICLIPLFILASVSFFYQDYGRTFLWHKHNGDQVRISTYRVSLPRNWVPKQPMSDGTVIVRTARVTLSQSGSAIRFTPLAPEDVASSGAIAYRVVQTMVAGAIHDRGPADSESPSFVTISAMKTFYCVKEVFITEEQNLRCIAAGFPYTVSATGIPQQEQQVKAILTSLE